MEPSPADDGQDSPEWSPLITPRSEENLELFFAYPGSFSKNSNTGNYRKAIMGMFYSSVHQLLAICSFEFVELGNKLPTSPKQKNQPKKPSASEKILSGEFRMYTKLIEKPQTRSDLGVFWKSVKFYSVFHCHFILFSIVIFTLSTSKEDVPTVKFVDKRVLVINIGEDNDIRALPDDNSRSWATRNMSQVYSCSKVHC